jgi:hypothetical protein
MKNKAVYASSAGLFWCCLVLASCAGRHAAGPLSGEPDAVSLATEAMGENAGIASCKGIAWLTLSIPGKPDQKYRLAWASALPDKTRMTLLSSGLPVETVVADGARVTVVSHNGAHDTRILNDPDPSLEELLSIPVSLREVMAILAGRIPARPFDRAAWNPGPAREQDRTLLLSRRWRGEVARLFWNPALGFHRVQSLDTDQNPVYTVDRDDPRDKDAFRVPHRYRISDRSGRSLSLEITQFQANNIIKPSTFSLTEAGE